MSHVIILAESTAEANAYRQKIGMTTGQAIYATSAARIDGVVPHAIHTLPGFDKRRDCHAILAAVKRASRKFQSVTWSTIDERGPVTERAREVAYRYDRLRDLEPLQVWAVSPNGDVEPVSPNDEDDKPQWQKDLDAVLEPEGWEPPETLNAEQILRLAAGESGAEVAPMEGREEPKPTRRSRCKDCGALHFKGEPCLPSDPDAFFGGA